MCFICTVLIGESARGMRMYICMYRYISMRERVREIDGGEREIEKHTHRERERERETSSALNLIIILKNVINNCFTISHNDDAPTKS